MRKVTRRITPFLWFDHQAVFPFTEAISQVVNCETQAALIEMAYQGS
jgi:predicted 3-demethylubiquinone-9 3-methyltransferase (glyoxalase superfamily)